MCGIPRFIAYHWKFGRGKRHCEEQVYGNGFAAKWYDGKHSVNGFAAAPVGHYLETRDPTQVIMGRADDDQRAVDNVSFAACHGKFGHDGRHCCGRVGGNGYTAKHYQGKNFINGYTTKATRRCSDKNFINGLAAKCGGAMNFGKQDDKTLAL